MKRLSFLILFLFCANIFIFKNGHAEKKKTGPKETFFYSRIKISKKYMQGSYLLYDCEDRHYACVDKSDFITCQAKRKVTLREGVDFRFNCAPLKKFDTAVLCIKNIYHLQSRVRYMEICSVDIKNKN